MAAEDKQRRHKLTAKASHQEWFRGLFSDVEYDAPDREKQSQKIL